MNQDEITRLANAIFYWLNYQHSVSRSDILLESSVRYPLVEYIERQLQIEVKLEKLYDDLGKRRVDFSFDFRGNGCNIELKFLSKYTSSDIQHQFIFNDLLRLSILKGVNYFVLCGSSEHFLRRFKYAPVKIEKGKVPDTNYSERLPNTEFAEWFPFESQNPKRLILTDLKRLDCFEKSYGIIHDRIKSLEVELVACSDNQCPQVVYVWKVTNCTDVS